MEGGSRLTTALTHTHTHIQVTDNESLPATETHCSGFHRKLRRSLCGGIFADMTHGCDLQSRPVVPAEARVVGAIIESKEIWREREGEEKRKIDDEQHVAPLSCFAPLCFNE